MAQTIEDVESRTVLQQFHSLYKKQDTIETNVQNVDAKVEKEKSDRQTADQGLQKLIYQQATDLGLEISTVKNDTNTNTHKIEYNATQISALKSGKQDKLTAGTNITIDANNVISASGGISSGEKWYEHSIMLRNNSFYYADVYLVIKNRESTAMTFKNLYDYLVIKNYKYIVNNYPTNLNVDYAQGIVQRYIFGIYADPNQERIFSPMLKFDASIPNLTRELLQFNASNTITDTVTEL